jgi:hypothetical protein
MKKIATILLLMCQSAFLFAQETAINWKLKSCSSIDSVELYQILDAGNTVIMMYEHMCGSCTNAANRINGIVNRYNNALGGKVKLYFLDNGGYPCSQSNSWVSTNSYNGTAFSYGSNFSSHYGGSGMPIVVVAGNSARKVYFKNLNGFSSSDTVALKNAINQSLTDAGLTGMASQSSQTIAIEVFPNPNNGRFQIQVNTAAEKHLQILDVVGNRVYDSKWSCAGNCVWSSDNMPTLKKGVYFISIESGEARLLKRLVIAE